jgi:hypothetical protein
MITDGAPCRSRFLVYRWVGGSAFLLLIMLAAGCSRNTTPVPETDQPPHKAASVELTNGWKLSLKVVPDQPRMVHAAIFTLHISDRGGKPVENAEVMGTLNMTLMDMGKTELKFDPKGHGDYEATVKSFDMSGPWEIAFDAAEGTAHAHKVFQFTVFD